MPNMIKAAMEIIPEAQKQDIAVSKGPTDVFRDLYRVKQYVKDDEMSLGCNPRDLAFPEPYQYAASRTGCTWTEGNRTFLGQLAACNIACPYCYRECGSAMETVDVSPEEYVDAFTAYNQTFPQHRSGVLRVSGGEPFLYQNWVREVAACAFRLDEMPCVWIDTNGTISPNEDLLDVLSSLSRVAVNLCFKPGVQGVQLDKQLRVADELVSAGVEVFFYWPAWDGMSTHDNTLMRRLLSDLADISHYAPLRLTVIEIKRYSTVAARGWQPYNCRDDHQASRLSETFKQRRRALNNWLTSRYDRDELWQPGCRLPLR